jgi:cytochrome bd ubiquinol oxidase subunit I
VSIGLGIAAFFVPLQMYLGDSVAVNEVVAYQPAKVEAMEGNYANGKTGWLVFAIPDQQAQRNIVEISIPCLGSAFDGDLSCQTDNPGLDNTPPADQPRVATTFWGFRVMWYGGVLMFGTVFYATILRFRRTLWSSTGFHRFLMWATPVGIIAILGGWVTAETGRQPWVVFGQLRTSDAVSPLAPSELVFSVAGFLLLYLLMLVAYIASIVHAVRIGPKRDRPAMDAQPQTSLDTAPVASVNGAAGATRERLASPHWSPLWRRASRSAP